VDAIRDFWSSRSSSTGTVVLILDALSLRELPLILAAGQKRGIKSIRHRQRRCSVASNGSNATSTWSRPISAAGIRSWPTCHYPS
jgi:hypothetical protein